MTAKPSPEQIAEHRAFLAKVTANARAALAPHIDPLSLGVIRDLFDGLEDAAREEGRFTERYPDA